MVETLDNEQFLEILKQCCDEEGGVDDEKLNLLLQNFFPYNLTFGRGRYL